MKNPDELQKVFRIMRRSGEARPDKNALFNIVDKDSEYAKAREEALLELEESPSFYIQTRRAPTKCPLCGTTASDYREEHLGQELLLPTGHPFTCAVCGNTEWNFRKDDRQAVSSRVVRRNEPQTEHVVSRNDEPRPSVPRGRVVRNEPQIEHVVSQNDEPRPSVPQGRVIRDEPQIEHVVSRNDEPRPSVPRGRVVRNEPQIEHVVSRNDEPRPSVPRGRVVRNEPQIEHRPPIVRPRPSVSRNNEPRPSVPHGHVIKNAVQTIVNALAPPDAFTFSQFLYQRTNERMLVIQRELVEELIQKAKLQNYLSVKNELILLYPLKSPENLYYMWNGVPHYTFENHVGSSIKATGFWYITDSGQYVEYLEREQPSDCVNLAVVYSNRPVNEQKLRDWHEVCDMCDCVLWVNLRNINQTPFYAFPKLYSPPPFSVRFPHKPGCGTLRESADIVSGSQLSSRAQSGWISFDDSTSDEANNFKISPNFIQRLFEQLRRVRMSPDCCVAVTYGAGFDPTGDHAMTLLNEPFLNSRVLSPRYGTVDVDAEFFNTTYPDSATDGTPKLVFLFSGGDIDARQMQSRLIGRDSALILNVEDAQHFRLCRLFPNR